MWFFSLSPGSCFSVVVLSRPSQGGWIQHEIYPIDCSLLNWPSFTQVKSSRRITLLWKTRQMMKSYPTSPQNRTQCGCTQWSPLDVHLSSLWSSQWASFGEYADYFCSEFTVIFFVWDTANQQSSSGRRSSQTRWDPFRCATLDRLPPFCSLTRRSPCRGLTSTTSFKELHAAFF